MSIIIVVIRRAVYHNLYVLTNVSEMQRFEAHSLEELC